ncbi:putative Acyltransferase family protein [uncultured Gammaproteobacteria bacterium]
MLYHTLRCFSIYGIEEDGNIFLDFFTNGPLAVYVFFVLSGFALSTSFFVTGDQGVVVASALRRYMRLTVPIFMSSILAFCLLKAGLMFNAPAGNLAASGDWLNVHYQFMPTLFGLIEFSFYDVYFAAGNSISYNAVLWTMPLELFGSMLVFAILYVVGNLKWRYVVYGLACLILARFNSHLIAFVFGVIFADIYQSPALQRFRTTRLAAGFALVMVSGAFLMATWLGVWFTEPPEMSSIAALLVLAVVICRPLADVFETNVSRFMGRISFPIYLIHLIVICSFSSWFYVAMADSGWSHDRSGFATLVVTVVVTLIGGVLFEPVERLSVLLARRFSDAVFAAVRWRAKPDFVA